MSARLPTVDEYTDSVRHAIGFALLYFLCGAMAVDVVLQKQWEFVSGAFKQRLQDLTDVARANKSNER